MANILGIYYIIFIYMTYVMF